MPPRIRRLRRSATTPDEILLPHSKAVRDLAYALRKLVKATVPAAQEVGYPVWHGIGYRDPEAGYVCAIFPQRDHVRLGFEQGARLPDRDRLLTGSGRQVRYVVIRSRRDIRSGPLVRLIRAAVGLGIARRAR